jgi:hypothetical protein
MMGMEGKRHFGIAVACTILGGLVGSSIPQEKVHSGRFLNKNRDALVSQAEDTMAGTLIGAAIGVAIDFAITPVRAVNEPRQPQQTTWIPASARR